MMNDYSSSFPWMNLMPSFPSFGTTGQKLGYYHNIAYVLYIAPLALLLIIAIAYNVLVGFATTWMYKNAWLKKLGVNPTDPKNPIPETNTWEEVFVVNTKIANYLLGGNAVVIKEQSGYLVLQIHDYIVNMPLAIVFIQVSQLAVAMIMVVLFMDYLVLQVTHICDPSAPGVDCFLNNQSSGDTQPLDCSIPDITTNVTCFNLKFNPLVSAAITGGFLKFGPHILYSALTFQYFKYLNLLKQKLKFNSTKGNIVVHIFVSIVLEVCFIGFGLMVLLVVVLVPSVREVTFATANPMTQLAVIFGFIMYFLMAGFLWCIYPQTNTPVRFFSAVWKGNRYATLGKSPINEGGEKLRPWVVVDPSLSTSERQYLLKD